EPALTTRDGGTQLTACHHPEGGPVDAAEPVTVGGGDAVAPATANRGAAVEAAAVRGGDTPEMKEVAE
ncbi:hypothetical protein ACIBP4_22800, partial [Micromonospora maritima]